MDTLTLVTCMAVAVALMLAGLALYIYSSAVGQDGMVVIEPVPVAQPAVAAPPPSPAVVAFVNTNPPATTGFDDDDDDTPGGEIPPEILAAWADEPEAAAVKRPSQAKTLYEALGVTQDASDDELRAAYRAAAKQWHTDTNHDPHAADEFNVVREAYSVLSDLDMRSKYDTGLNIETGEE